MQPDGLPFQSLALEPAIETHFLTVTPDTPVIDVLALMSQFRSCKLPDGDSGRASQDLYLDTPKISCISQEWDTVFDVADTAAGCVLVMEESRLVGVFTERDIVRLTAANIPLASVKMAEIAKQPVITLQQSQAQDVFTALGLFRQHRIRHLPIVDDQEQPIGIVTHESIRRALQPVNLLTRLRYVKDVMTSQVIHAPKTASVLHLAQLMTQHQVSCIVITQEGQETRGLAQQNLSSSYIPVGIVTERDIVQFQALELDLSRMQAQEVMSTPLFCLQPSDSLWLAHDQMHHHHVRRIVVTGSQGELLGIVSQTSLLQVLNPADMYGVIELLQQMVEQRTSEIEKANEQLRYEVVERQRAEIALLEAHALLKQQVEERTAQLRQTNAQLKRDILERQQVEAALRQSEAKLKKQATKLKRAIHELRSYQTQLIQTEKMSSLGQLVAGVAHEINNPINFVYGNIAHASEYMHDLLELLQLYEQSYPQPEAAVAHKAQDIDLNFVRTDLPKLFDSMKLGAERIRDLVVSLRNFSRLDEAEMKSVDVHEGIDSTLLILQNQLKATLGRSEIKVIKEYSELPLVECYAGQINQVLMNLLSNAIDALEESRIRHAQGATSHIQLLGFLPTITICTGLKQVGSQAPTSQSSRHTSETQSCDPPWLVIRIADNGMGMTEAVLQQLFDPFFTTKPVGKGTGLGLSISYQIVVKKHGGRLYCLSREGEGTEFVVEIPIRQRHYSANVRSLDGFKTAVSPSSLPG